MLSTDGTPQIVTRVADFSKQIGEPIDPLGIVVSKYRIQNTVHVNMVKQLAEEKDAPCFKTTIPESTNLSDAAAFTGDRTIKQKYGYKGEPEMYLALADEILAKL